MEHIQRYLASIEDAKRRKRMPKMFYVPSSVCSRSSHGYLKHSFLGKCPKRTDKKKIEVTSCNSVAYCQERQWKQFVELFKSKKIEQMLAMREDQSSSSEESRRNSRKKKRPVVVSRKIDAQDEMCISILLMMKEIISQLLKRKLMDALGPKCNAKERRESQAN
ncbi:hypothetical protein Ciccas_014594 [Cichlidogyrus casuarinus]|uniref:Uncharacterized protein n=1 Tax=Cichlidogyrus casuarinus TaxID=1844966 RepID=A0ABD2PIV1_9PLAT